MFSSCSASNLIVDMELAARTFNESTTAVCSNASLGTVCEVSHKFNMLISTSFLIHMTWTFVIIRCLWYHVFWHTDLEHLLLRPRLLVSHHISSSHCLCHG